MGAVSVSGKEVAVLLRQVATWLRCAVPRTAAEDIHPPLKELLAVLGDGDKNGLVCAVASRIEAAAEAEERSREWAAYSPRGEQY
jgi:hypothetical protein